MRGNQISARPPGKSDPDEEHPYLLGQRFYSFSELKKSVVIVGSPGSGKTVQLILLLKSIAGQIMKPDSMARALIYDSKTDLIPRIASMGLPENRIKILDPIDARRYGVDLAKDIRTEAEAQDLAASLIPVPKNASQPFFAEAAQVLLTGLVQVFQHFCPDDWELRDLVLSVRTMERLAYLYSQTPETRSLLEEFEPEGTFRNVKSSFVKSLTKLKPFAASWHAAKLEGREISLGDWLDEQSLLILGNHSKTEEAHSAINNLILTRLGKQVLGREGERSEHNFFILDEFRELGKIDIMSNWAALGRSNGSCLCLGFQDVEGVEDVYGREKAREILGNCANLGILHINPTEPHTQEWASKVLGKVTYEIKEITEGETYGRMGSTSISERWVEKTEYLWLPSMFATELPQTSLKAGCQGLFRLENSFYRTNILGKHLFTEEGTYHRYPEERKDLMVAREPIDPKKLKLEDWNEDDFKRLGIPGLKEVASIQVKPPSELEKRIQQALKQAESPTQKPEQEAQEEPEKTKPRRKRIVSAGFLNR